MLRTKNKLTVLVDDGIETPSAPVAQMVAGGALEDGATYSVLVTFYDSATSRESIQGAASNTVTGTATLQAIALTSIPVSTDSSVTSRKIYLKKNAGSYIYSQTIDDNATTAANVTTLSVDFSGDGTGFTETGTGIDWSGASAQVEQYAGAAGELFYASFSASTTAERSDGDATDAHGSVTISGGKADLTGYVTNERLQYDVSAGDILPLNTGTIEFFFTPNFTGAPTEKQNIVVFNHTSGNVNLIDLRYDSSQQWLIRIYDSGAAVMVSQVISAVGQFTSGTEYHIALSWDLATADECKLFVDGVQVGSTFTNSGGSRTTAGVTLLHIGNTIAGNEDPNFFIRDFLVTNTYDRAAAFTAPTSGLVYSTAAAKVAYDTTVEGVGMQDLAETVSKPANTAITYTMTIGGTEYYVTGGAWASSDGTASQSSSVTDLNAVADSFPVNSSPETIQLNAFLVSSDGRSTPTITTLALDYFPEGAIEEDSVSAVTPPDTITSNSFTEYSDEMLSFQRDTLTVSLDTANDYIYVGYYKPVHAVYLAFSTANTNEGTLAGEFYNGTSWTSIVGLLDETKSFTRDGFIQWDKNQADEAETTVDSLSRYWYRFRPDTAHSATVLKGLNIVFADDQDLKVHFFEVSDYLPSGESSHILTHVAARDEIVQYLRNSGHYKQSLSTGDLKDITAFDLLDLGQIKLAATYLALSKIYFNISDSIDDIYQQKSGEYYRLYSSAIKTWYLDLDADDDGISDESEELAESTVSLVRR